MLMVFNFFQHHQISYTIRPWQAFPPWCDIYGLGRIPNTSKLTNEPNNLESLSIASLSSLGPEL
jgi:hypothetical protein